jgi:DivIVA domain-containing protein
MDITPRELRDVEIRESFRGYHRDDVNELLERAAATLEAANERMQQMNERLTTVQSETGHTRETEDILHRTLLLAQRAADEAVGEATAKARQMLDDAEIQSRRLVADSEADARRRGETERRRLEEEVLDLAGRRDALLADVEALTRFEADYRDRMVRALEADLSALRSRPPASPGPRPEPSDVDLPVFSEGFARREPTEPPAVSEPPPARTPDPFAGASSEPAPSFVAAPTSFAAQIPPTFSTQPPPAPSGEPERATSEGSTQAVDVQSLFDRAGMGGAALAFEKPAGTAVQLPSVDPFAPKPAAGKILADDPPDVSSQGATPAEGASPVNAPAADAIDAEVLDDDAFFATLREAVHDDTPLGPREEGDATGENMFFDQEVDNPGFRDVFRRRR